MRWTRQVGILLAAMLLAAGCGGSTEIDAKQETAGASPQGASATHVEVGAPNCQPLDTEGQANDQGYNDRCEEYVGDGSVYASGSPPALALAGNGTAGKAIFTSAGCGGCHTLAAAGTKSDVGPNLDESKPSIELVVYRATLGGGNMPSFAAKLNPQQIADVAVYVNQRARRGVP